MATRIAPPLSPTIVEDTLTLTLPSNGFQGDEDDELVEDDSHSSSPVAAGASPPAQSHPTTPPEPISPERGQQGQQQSTQMQQQQPPMKRLRERPSQTNISTSYSTVTDENAEDDDEEFLIGDDTIDPFDDDDSNDDNAEYLDTIAAVSSPSNVRKHYPLSTTLNMRNRHVAPSPALKRQVREAQEAAIRLVEQRQALKAAQEEKQSQNSNNSGNDALIVLPAPPTNPLNELESMQIWGRVVSVLSLDGEIATSDASSDGTLLATASGKSCHVWSTPSMQHIIHLNTHAHANVVHQAPLRLVRFTPFNAELQQQTGFGHHLITAGDDLKIVLWDLSTGKILRILLGHKDLIFSMIFSTKSELLFTSSADGQVLVWDWAYTGALLGSYARETGGIRSVALLEDYSKLLTACSATGDITIWDVKRHERVGVLPPDKEWSQKYRKSGPTNGGWIDGQRFHTGMVSVVRTTADGTILASASDDATVKLWSILSLRRDGASLEAAKKNRQRERSHLIPLEKTQPERDSLEALDGEEAPLDIGYHGTLLHTLRHEGPVVQILFTPDSSFILTAARDQSVRVWLVETGALVYQINVPAQILDVSFSYAPESFELDSKHALDPTTPNGKKKKDPIKYFYLGRIHITVMNRVLVMDLAVLESVIHPPPNNTTSSDPGSVHEWPPASRGTTANSTTSSAGGRSQLGSRAAAARRTRRRRERAESAAFSASAAAASAAATPVVTSDALLNQFLPGASKLLRDELASGSLPPLTSASLNFAPNFLHQLLEGPQGNGVDRRRLIENMRYFGLTATYLLRIISSTIQFTPKQVLQGFAKPQPECNGMFKLAFAGVPIQPALLDLGFLPQRLQQPAATVKSSPSVQSTTHADPTRLYETPFEPHALPDGSNKFFDEDAEKKPFQYLATDGPNSTEGFFFEPMKDKPVTNGDEAEFEPSGGALVHFHAATQLNLLAHLSSNAPIAAIHAESALNPAHVKYPLFRSTLSQEEYVDEREKLEARRRGAIADPYGGMRNARLLAQMEHQLLEANTASKAHEQQVRPQGGSIKKGYTISSRPEQLASNFDPSINSPSIASPSSASITSGSNTTRATLFSSFVAGQIVPNGERVSAKTSGSRTARQLQSSTSTSANTPRLGGIMDRATNHQNLTEKAISRSVAIPLRRTIGLKPTAQPLSEAESKAALDAATHAAPVFGTRTFHKPSRAESHAAVVSKLEEFDPERSAPVSLNQLLQTFSATDIERKIDEGFQRVKDNPKETPLGRSLAANKKMLSATATSQYSHMGGFGNESLASKSIGSEAHQRTAAAASALRDHDFREEIRRALLHQTNTLGTLDTEFNQIGAISGQVREYTHSQQQLINPFGGKGSSGLTLLPHQSAHTSVGQGLSSLWRTRGGGYEATEREYTSHSLEHSIQGGGGGSSLLSPLHQFSTMPQRVFAVPPSGPHVNQDVFPGMNDVFRHPGANATRMKSASSTTTTPAAPIETQLQKAYSSEQKYKWINKFSVDVPGLDVMFDIHAPLRAISPSSPKFVSSSFATTTGSASPLLADDAAGMVPPTPDKSPAKHGRRSVAPKLTDSASTPNSSRRSRPLKKGNSHEPSSDSTPLPPPLPDVIRINTSTATSVSTRPFMLRPPETQAAQTMMENQLDLGLSVLPDVNALQSAVRVELDQPKPMAQEAQTTMQLVEQPTDS